MSRIVKPKVVFVLGGPGSGKGTQCQKIVKEFGYVHLSAGELLRQERIDRATKYADEIDKHLVEGTIVPVAITVQLLHHLAIIINSRIRQAMITSGKERFLIDGFPRNEDNFVGWNREMGDKADVDFVLVFKCSLETCVSRCLSRGETSGRSDDNLDSLKKRITTFTTVTMPIIDHYAESGAVRTIDAERPVDEVYEDVRRVFEDHLSSL